MAKKGKRYEGKVLRVRVGPDNVVKTICDVNNDFKPVFIYNNDFIGNITVRVVNFSGVTPTHTPPIPMTEYFGTRKRLFSVQIQGRFRKDWTIDDINFGGAFNHKVSLPYGAGLAIKLAQMIDPALQNNINDEKPSMTSPILCQMNIVNVTEAKTPLDKLPEIPWDKLQNSQRTSFSCEGGKYLATTEPEALGIHPEEYLNDWTWGGKTELKENTTLLFDGEKREHPPFECTDLAARRKYFQKVDNRKAHAFSSEKIYNLEVFAPFINFNTFDISLGININILKYLNNQPLRLIARTNEKNVSYDVTNFFNIEFDLVEQELEDNVLTIEQPSPIEPEINVLSLSPAPTIDAIEDKKEDDKRKSRLSECSFDSDDFEDALDEMAN